MRKRAPFKHILPLALCLGLILTLLPSAALAVETYTTSDEGVAFIKEFEGFKSMAYSDKGEWYIGYGTLCDPADYPNGVSEAEAEPLTRSFEGLFAAVERLGLDHAHPMTFLTLMALAVSLEIKCTDIGLVDVREKKRIPVIIRTE